MSQNDKVLFRTQEYRIYPTREQIMQLTARFEQEDAAYNMLAETVNSAYSRGMKQTELSKLVQERCLPASNEADNYAISRIRARINGLLLRLCSGQMPKIASRKIDRSQRSASFRYAGVSDYQLSLPIIGSIAMEQHRDLPCGAHIYSATVYADCYNVFYHVALHLIMPQKEVIPSPMHYCKVIGLDDAQDGLYVDSCGRNAQYPAFRHQAMQKLKRTRHAAARFRPSSRRWRKFRQRIAKIERHVANQRKDWQYKHAHQLAQQFDAICIEDLNFGEMIRNDPSLAIKLYDNAPAAFYKRLDQVFTKQGKRVIRVGRYYPSSQICSGCGRKVGKLPLDAPFVCPYCGLKLNRNHNAARNIREEGIRQLDQ